MGENLTKKIQNSLNPIDNFLDERKLLWETKSKLPWFWYSKFPLTGRKFEEKSKIPQILPIFFQMKKKVKRRKFLDSDALKFPMIGRKFAEKSRIP